MRQSGAKASILAAMTDREAQAGGPIATRWSGTADDVSLAEVHREAWRYAYAGIIPGLTLERMIARRGPTWWGRMHARGFHALVVDCGGTLAGYATLGRGRAPGRQGSGEIYELYLRPEFQGCGLGRRLFAEARRELARHGLRRLTVWALSENEIACRFYRAMGGAETGRAVDRFCGVPLAKTGFAWN
jgi:ribosomal protein S18 acetylase RimI-like enzyme